MTPTLPTDRIETSRETRLRVIRRNGDTGASFLLVHGLSSNARLWDEVAEELAGAGHASVAVDQRGHGLSTEADTAFDFTTLTDDLAHVITATLRPPVIVAGQSWGGNVVLELAARRPDLVAGVVCVDGGFIRLQNAFPDWETAKAALTPPPLAGTPAAELERRIRSSLAGFPEAGVAAQMANFEIDADGLAHPRLTLERHMIILRHLWEHDPLTAAASVTQPTLVIAVGEEDGDRATWVARFVATLPDGRSVWLRGHHDVHAEQPHVVAGLMEDLATRVGPRRMDPA